MPNVGVNNDAVDVPTYTPTPAPVTSSQSFFRVNNAAVLLDGDSVTDHSLGSSHHTERTLTASQSFFRVNTIPVAMGGDVSNCSHPIIEVPGGDDVVPKGLLATGFMTITPT